MVTRRCFVTCSHSWWVKSAHFLQATLSLKHLQTLVVQSCTEKKRRKLTLSSPQLLIKVYCLSLYIYIYYIYIKCLITGVIKKKKNN